MCLASSAPALAAPPSREECAARDNGTQAKLLECISERDLWSHLKTFQKIADEHPGPLGHGNRNTGTSGYKASVDYIARQMRDAGYRVTIQPYRWRRFDIVDEPLLERVGPGRMEGAWFVARLSGSGDFTAPVQPVGRGVPGGEPKSGCEPVDFAGFVRGHIALLERGACDYDTQAANATAAGAAAALIYNGPRMANESGRGGRRDGGAFQAMLAEPACIPVFGVTAYTLGAELARAYAAGEAPALHFHVRTRQKSNIDYNLIADAPLGDPNHIVVLEGHLDSIYGAGMLDNASGSATMLEIALAMAHTHTRHRLRYIWFGGEEIGLLGSKYYTRNLTKKENRRIVFDIDADVTATPNFAILVADPKNASNAKRFPPNVVPESRVGNRDFIDYFRSAGIVAREGNNDGTDSNAFSRVGIPNTGIYTQQDCCKKQWEVDLWGGYPGDFEGKVPGWHAACVDQPHRWCDNLSNNDPFVLGFVSKAVAAVTLRLANDASLDHENRSKS
ncbi:MAG: M28 family peptidase [Rhizomicrobium sp.]